MYTIEQFFDLFANSLNKRILIFIDGGFVSLTKARFVKLRSCSFVYLGQEWMINKKENKVAKL